jgi:hypothetical protein
MGGGYDSGATAQAIVLLLPPSLYGSNTQIFTSIIETIPKLMMISTPVKYIYRKNKLSMDFCRDVCVTTTIKISECNTSIQGTEIKQSIRQLTPEAKKTDEPRITA